MSMSLSTGSARDARGRDRGRAHQGGQPTHGQVRPPRAHCTYCTHTAAHLLDRHTTDTIENERHCTYCTHILPRTYSPTTLLKDIALLKGRGRGGIAPTTARPTASTTPYYCSLPTAHSSLLPAGTSWRAPASPTCCTTSRAARHGLTTWSRSGEEPEVDSRFPEVWRAIDRMAPMDARCLSLADLANLGNKTTTNK